MATNISLMSDGAVTSIFDLPPEGSFYYKIEGFLALFYLVHPKRTMCPTMETPNFYLMAVAWAPLMFVLEFAMFIILGLPKYRWNDSLAGLCAIVTGSIPQVFLEFGVYSFYTWIYANFRLVDVPFDSWSTWFICILAADLSFYVAHRLMHEVNLFWASHQLHHSSEFYNFFSPARNSFSDKFLVTICTLPWAFVLPVGPMRAHHQLNFSYQFSIHTQVVGDMGWLEYILVTPTQHAVHHGRNRFCIDMNYGGFLSIWDNLFKTMASPREHKDKEISYGLVHPVATWDVLYLYGHSYLDIFRRVKKYDTISDKLSVVFKGPGWDQGKPRLGYLEEIPEEPEDKQPYDKQSPTAVYIYCALNTAFCYAFNTALVSRCQTMPLYMVLTGVIFSTWTVANIGYFLEHKRYAPKSEWFRCLMFYVIAWLFADTVLVSFGIVVPILQVWFALCLVFWPFNLDFFTETQVNEIEHKVKVN